MTSAISGRHIRQLIAARSRQASITLVGYPSSSSTGDISRFAVPKLNAVVNTSVLANPHSPFTKNALTAAIIQSAISSAIPYASLPR